MKWSDLGSHLAGNSFDHIEYVFSIMERIDLELTKASGIP